MCLPKGKEAINTTTTIFLQLLLEPRDQSKLAFLNRKLKGCPQKLRDTAYISLIRPALEYSCSCCVSKEHCILDFLYILL